MHAAIFGIPSSDNVICELSAKKRRKNKRRNSDVFQCDHEAALNDSISAALLDILGLHWVVPGRGGVGVRGLTSSFDSTANRSLGTKPVAVKLNVIGHRAAHVCQDLIIFYYYHNVFYKRVTHPTKFAHLDRCTPTCRSTRPSQQTRRS